MIEKLRQRFVKDNKISLQIFESPYFEERLKLFGYLEQYESFVDMVTTRFKSIEEYFSYYNTVKDSAIDFIKNSEAYQLLNSDDMNKYPKYNNINQSDVYKDSNIGKTFISIDMKKANFSALVKYAKDTNTKFFDSYNYDDFMKLFTDCDYIIQSKYIRQVIFGNCNPKRQITYESYLMSNLLTNLISNNLVSESDVYSMCSDEIIIKVNENTNTEAITKYCKNFNDFPISCEKFILYKLNNTKAYLKQTILTNTNVLALPTIKCVNPYEAPFIYRFMNNEPYQDSDYVFMFEDKLARLLEAPNISISIK